MKKHYFNLCICFLFLAADMVILSACYRNASATRSTAILVDDSTATIFSERQYAAFMKSNPALTGTIGAEMVRRVGIRMTTAALEYAAIAGRPALIKDYTWQYNLVNSEDAIAWCLPGGKIVVYDGILHLTQTEVGLAAVMGHIIAHTIARHGYERMNLVLQQQYSGASLAALLSGQTAATQSIFAATYGATSTLSTLAYTRKQENEVDEMSLYFLALAGYNPTDVVTFWRLMAGYNPSDALAFSRPVTGLSPNEALAFWHRMAEYYGSQTPAFLIIHPIDQDRINNMVALLPRAMQLYRP